MNKDFARILTLLRKEKKLSQKQAAEDLGISQALLSHYEKGIRECGLDFVVRAADYYHVSADYLLGRTAERELELNETGDSHTNAQGTYHLISQKVIAASISVIYDLTARAGSRRLSRAVTVYLMTGIYRLFRALYSANDKNPQDMFTVQKDIYRGYSSAAQLKLISEIEYSCTENVDNANIIKDTSLSPDILAKEYPSQAAALFNVIQQAENNVNKLRR